MTTHQSSSEVQQRAEAAILASLARQTEFAGVGPATEPLPLGGGVRINVDGQTPDGSVLVEAFARQGALKPGQLKKVAQDILKLSLVRAQPGGENTRLVIVFASAEALNSVRGWLRRAAQVHDVEFVVVDIEGELRDEILSAQARQKMVNVDVVADDIDLILSDPITPLPGDLAEDWTKRTFDFWRSDTEQMDTIAEVGADLCESDLQVAIMINNYPYPDAIPPRLMSEARSILEREAQSP